MTSCDATVTGCVLWIRSEPFDSSVKRTCRDMSVGGVSLRPGQM